MQILKIRLFHVRKGPNIDFGPNFHYPTTSNGRDYPEQLNSQPHREPPDAEDVGEKAVADNSSAHHAVVILLTTHHQPSQEECNTVRPG